MTNLRNLTAILLISSTLSAFCGDYIHRSKLRNGDIVSFKSLKSNKFLTFTSKRQLKANGSSKSAREAKFQVVILRDNSTVRLRPLNAISKHHYVYTKSNMRASYTTTAHLPSNSSQSKYWISPTNPRGSGSEVSITSVYKQKNLKTNSKGSYTKFNTTSKSSNTKYLLYRH